MRVIRYGLRFFVNRRLSLCFASWLATLDEYSQAFERTAILMRAAMRLKHRALARCWTSWAAHAVQSASDLRRLRSALSEWMGSRQRAAWSAWYDFTSHKLLLIHVLNQIRLASVVRALNKWRHVVEASLAALSSLEHASKFYSPTFRATKKAMHTWRVFRNSRQPLRYAILAMMHRSLHAGLLTWSEAAAVRKSARQNQHQILHSALSAIRLRGARAALNTWVSLAAERAEATRRLLSAAAVFRSDGVRKAFNSWLDTSAQRAVMYRALAIFTQRGLSAGFKTWASAAESLSKLERIRRSAMMEWLGSNQRAAWATWRLEARRRHLLLRAVLYFRSPSLRRALSTWATFAAQAIVAYRHLNSAAASFAKLNLRRALNSWKEISEHLALKTLAALCKRDLRRCFSTWQAVFGYQSALEKLMLRPLASFANLPMRMCFNTWLSTAKARAFEKSVMQNVAKAMSSRASAALSTWITYTQQRHEIDRMMRWFVSRLTPEMRALGAAMRKWVSIHRRYLELRRAMMAFVSQGLRLCFNTWSAMRVERTVMQRAVLSLKSRGVRAALNRWVEVATLNRSRLDAIGRSVAAMRQAPTRIAINTWLAFVAQTRETHRIMIRAATGFALEERVLRRALNTWAEDVDNIKTKAESAAAWHRSFDEVWARPEPEVEQATPTKIADAGAPNTSPELKGWKKAAAAFGAPSAAPGASAVADIAMSIQPSVTRTAANRSGFGDCLAVHSASDTLLTAGRDGDKNTVSLYSLVMNGGALKGTLDGHSAGVRCVVSDGDVIASGDEDGKIRLWSLQTCQCTGELEGSNRTVHGLGLKGDTLVSGGYDRAVRIWSVAKRKLLSTMIEHSGTVASVALGQKHVASASTDTTAKLWPLTGHYKSLATLQHPGPVYSVSVHGQSAATGCLDGNVRLWSLTTFRLTHTLAHSLDRVTSIKLLGPVLVSGSRDTQVKVWTLAGEGECIGTCDHGAPVLGVDVTPLGLVASVGYGGLKPRVFRMKNVNDIISGKYVPRGATLKKEPSSSKVAAGDKAAASGLLKQAALVKSATAFGSLKQPTGTPSTPAPLAQVARGASARGSLRRVTASVAGTLPRTVASPSTSSSGPSPDSVIKAAAPRMGSSSSKFAAAASSARLVGPTFGVARAAASGPRAAK